jgi:lipopolysaccharide/colanic/teichoic acid biosynthesis glycosyltransferase
MLFFMEPLTFQLTRPVTQNPGVAGERIDDKTLSFLIKHVNLKDRNETLILNTHQQEDMHQQASLNRLLGSEHQNIVNLKRINDIRRINKFFESVNEHLPMKGVFVSCVETKAMRKERILAKYPPVIRWLVYSADYIFKRIFPKVPLLKQLYFNFTKGKNRIITSVETMGRLYSCGFKVLDLHRAGNKLYIVAQKVKRPAFNLSPSYGPIFRMKRIGHNGNSVYVYKLRTMHPYAEYLQEYIYERNKLCEGGKFNNDIRVTTLGKVCRKFWLDEIPMLINLLKGDLKLVGVRPISEHYLSLYHEDLREIRKKVRPGLIPPYYADMPNTLDEIMESEMRYIEAYQKNPVKTDLKYFFRACQNILLRKARSQ